MSFLYEKGCRGSRVQGGLYIGYAGSHELDQWIVDMEVRESNFITKTMATRMQIDSDHPFTTRGHLVTMKFCGDKPDETYT